MSAVSKSDERGVVLIVVLVTMALLAALGAALTLATTTELAIAANYREAAETLYAAEAGVAFVMQEVAAVEDWNEVATGSGQSVFIDGPADGPRIVGAARFDLTDATNNLNAVAPAGPGAVPPWVLHAFGRFQDLVPSPTGRAPVYVAVWIANHSSSADESMRGALSLFGQAYGPRGSRRAVEVVVEKVGVSGVRRRLWREWP
jgi:Tfp pilus assembly protein PilX